MTASGTPILEVITYLQYLAQTIVSMSQQSECTQQNIVEHQLVKSWLWDFLSGLRAPCSDSQCSSQWKSQPENICSNMVSECAHVTWSTSISVISHSDLHFHDQAISCWGSDILGWGPLPKRKMWSAVTQKLSKDLAHQPRGGGIHRRSETAHQWSNGFEMLLNDFCSCSLFCEVPDISVFNGMIADVASPDCGPNGQVIVSVKYHLLLHPASFWILMSTFSCVLSNPPNWTQLHQCVTWGKVAVVQVQKLQCFVIRIQDSQIPEDADKTNLRKKLVWVYFT